MTDRPDSRPAGQGPAEDSRAEEVLSQTLRVMAGGGKPPTTDEGKSGSTRRLSTGQLILLAAIVGLLIGIGAGFLTLML